MTSFLNFSLSLSLKRDSRNSRVDCILYIDFLGRERERDREKLVCGGVGVYIQQHSHDHYYYSYECIFESKEEFLFVILVVVEKYFFFWILHIDNTQRKDVQAFDDSFRKDKISQKFSYFCCFCCLSKTHSHCSLSEREREALVVRIVESKEGFFS